MQLGESHNIFGDYINGNSHTDDNTDQPKPLDGIRILAVEQMQALPYATQMMARLGAEVVKVEHPVAGESGRSSAPFIQDPDGRQVGVTYLRNNFNKKSIGIDIKSEKGRELVLELSTKFDVFAENFKSQTLNKMGLGYKDVLAKNDQIVYLSISGFGNTDTPYSGWPAYAGVAEAMSSLYSWATPADKPPHISPLGAMGDTGSAVFGVIGVLAALRQRDNTGKGQFVDISMFDCMVALADVQIQYDSMNVERDPGKPGLLILDAFKASDGYFMIQVGREHQFEIMCDIIGKPEWKTDERFTDRQGWVAYLESDIRPAIEGWASSIGKLEASTQLAEAGVASGPCNSPKDVAADQHVELRQMITKMDLPDATETETPKTETPKTMSVPSNPVKISSLTEGGETRMPWLNEHTDEVLKAELALSDSDINELREGKIIG